MWSVAREVWGARLAAWGVVCGVRGAGCGWSALALVGCGRGSSGVLASRTSADLVPLRNYADLPIEVGCVW